MALYPMQDGVRKEVKQLFVHDDGLHKEAKEQWVFGDGLWKLVYSSGPPEIGEPWGGGFYLGEFDGYYHIIADKSSETNAAWGPTGVTGATSTTDSKYNTDILVGLSGAYPAAEHCRNYRGGGFDDWDWPAHDVLNLFWLNLAPGNVNTPAAFKTGGPQALDVPTFYWSSTEESRIYAGVQRFSDGSQQSSGKTNSRIVRAVRRIPI